MFQSNMLEGATQPPADRRTLRGGSSVLALAFAAMLAVPAHAQTTANASAPADTPAADKPADGQAINDQSTINTQSKGDIIVTGIRASVQSATQRKKNSEQIIDSITATDIGALPDRSVSEALQRIAGVTLQRTNENRDPARLSSEGGGVFIRGHRVQLPDVPYSLFRQGRRLAANPHGAAILR